MKYIITETSTPTSFDPLDADSTENLSVARMIYFTPIEVSHDDKLASNVLSAFSYDKAKREIELLVKNGNKFSNGTPITVEDVVFSILRMALKRPNFPVLCNIVGLSDWLKLNEPLTKRLSGVEVNGNRIIIRLDAAVDHPLSRFCLELFSIVPRSSVDAKTNKLVTAAPPTSGFYSIRSKAQGQIDFELRPEFRGKGNNPLEISFYYPDPKSFATMAKNLDENTIISGSESLFSEKELGEFSDKLTISYLPANRFLGFLLNPLVKPFDDVLCRNFFSGIFRKNFSSQGSMPFGLEASLFTKIMPAYLTQTQLDAGKPKIKNSEDVVGNCTKKIAEANLVFGLLKGLNNDVYRSGLEGVFQQLGLQAPTIKIFDSKTDFLDNFNSGKLAALPASSGFWPIDVVGDLKMLFTPNLHKQLAAFHVDKKFQELINAAYSAESTERTKILVKINQYLYNGSILNIFSHSRRFYVTQKLFSFDKLPSSIITPPVWDVCISRKRK